MLREMLLTLLSHSPRDFGFEQSRWTLGTLSIITVCWFGLLSETGLWKVLHRLGVRYRQGWEHIVRPRFPRERTLVDQ